MNKNEYLNYVPFDMDFTLFEIFSWGECYINLIFACTKHFC